MPFLILGPWGHLVPKLAERQGVKAPKVDFDWPGLLDVTSGQVSALENFQQGRGRRVRLQTGTLWKIFNRGGDMTQNSDMTEMSGELVGRTPKFRHDRDVGRFGRVSVVAQVCQRVRVSGVA